MDINRIPKIVWHIWIGYNPIPENLKAHVKTWKILEDAGYEIIPVGNADVDYCIDKMQSRCLEWATKNKKYTIVNHYLRYWFLWMNGGVYMDLDVEVIKPFDFTEGCILGMESERWINNHCIITEESQQIFKDAMDYMDAMDYDYTHEIELETGPRLISNLVYKNTTFKHRFLDQPYKCDYKGQPMTILPERYFSGHRWYQKFDPKEITEDTYCVHHYAHTWK
jgi:mannosyltransferase OCH1-like enzyme